MKPAWWPNLRSRNSTEMLAKWLTLVVFLGVYGVTLGFHLQWWPLFPARAWPPGLDDFRYQAGLYVPLISLFIYYLLHRADSSWRNVRGLKSRVDSEKAGVTHREFASSAISRLSIHSAIALGLIAGVRDGVKQIAMPSPSQVIVAFWTYCTLGLAVLFGMVAVLCYAHADRWETNNRAHPKFGLLREAKALDQLAFYALTTGMIWALALFSRRLSLVANLILGLLLWLYYFDFSKSETGAPEASQATEAAVSPAGIVIASAVKPTGVASLEQPKQGA